MLTRSSFEARQLGAVHEQLDQESTRRLRRCSSISPGRSLLLVKLLPYGSLVVRCVQLNPASSCRQNTLSYQVVHKRWPCRTPTYGHRIAIPNQRVESER